MISLFAAVIALLSPQVAKAEKPISSLGEGVRILPVSRTPEPNSVLLTIAVPEDGQVLPDNPIWVQFRLEGYALGASSPFDRADELAISDKGQTIHVIIDDSPRDFFIWEPAIDPFDEEGYFYDTSYKMEVPFSLKEGMHTIRMFPVRSFGESLKGEQTFHAISFYIGEKKENPNMDLSQPYLTYNEPSDFLYFVEGKPILLDFYLSNCELTPDGYKVQVAIDGKIKRTLTSWQPYYIYGLKRGKHSIRLRLIDAEGKLVPGLFNDVQRSFQIRS